MTDVFHSARLTFDRAQHHIREFKSILTDFVNSKPWTYFVDNDSDASQHIHKIKFIKQLPDELPCILFDIASNLRAVLDQAGYAATVATWRFDRAPRGTNFPFGDTAAEVEANIKRRKVCNLPAEIQTLFKAFKPYKTTDGTLWTLNKLCNTKKHCILVPLGILRAIATFSARVPDDTQIGRYIDQTGIVRGWDSEKREMTLVSVSPGLDPHISGNFSFDIALDGIDGLRDIPAFDLVGAMSGIVQSVLLATEAECRRLNWIP
jgi:hypothetical protein